MTAARSSLAPFAALMREPDPAVARQLAYAAWHEHGIVLVRADWFNSWMDGKQAELLAEKLYGRRKQNEGKTK